MKTVIVIEEKPYCGHPGYTHVRGDIGVWPPVDCWVPPGGNVVEAIALVAETLTRMGRMKAREQAGTSPPPMPEPAPLVEG